jgi:hypothetical protein
MKIVYQTDAEGFFTGPVRADPSPLEPGKWLIPGGAVETAPPDLTEGQRARWVDGAWAVIDPEPEPEAPEPTPEEIYAAWTSRVIAERDLRIFAGTTIAVPGIGDVPVSGSPVVQADLTALATAAQIAMAASNTEATFPFRDREGTTHGLSNEQVLELYMAGVDWLASMRAAAWALLDADPAPEDPTNDEHWP